MATILLVEDDAYLRTSLSRSLTRHGAHTVDLAESVDEAAALLRANEYQVLITDLDLLGASGLDLLRMVRDLDLPTRAILMSGFGSARDYQRAIGLGAVRVLCKPFTSAELASAIQQALECKNSFFGSIHGLGLIDILQMYHLGRRSICVRVSGHEQGRIYLRDGEIVHARIGEISGDLALRGVLRMHGGTLATEVVEGDIPTTIERPFSHALLDALRENDEEKYMEASFPSQDEIDLWETTKTGVGEIQRA